MSSLRDGMGGEELQVSGLQAGGVNISPHFTGSLAVDNGISGANIYSTGDLHGESVYGDTVVSGADVKGTNISGDNLKGTTISGTNIYAQTTMHADNVRADTNLSGASTSGGALRCDNAHVVGSVTNTEGVLQSTLLGSNTTLRYGGIVQAGSETLGEGSTVSVTFGAEFTSAPHVVCSFIDEPSSVGVVCGSNIATTGFEAIGDTASKEFHWIAIGD